MTWSKTNLTTSCLTWSINDIKDLHKILASESYFYKGDDTPVLHHRHEIMDHLNHNEKRSKAGAYTLDDVYYDTNMYGFRGEWRTVEDLKDVSDKVMILGCSNTYGTGIPKEHGWADIMNKRLKSDDLDLNFINLAMPGSGMQKQLRIANHFLAVMDFRAIIWLMPNMGRKELFVDYLNHDEHKSVNIIPSAPVAGLHAELKFKYERVVSDDYTIYELEKCLHHLLLAANNTQIFLSSWDPETYQALINLTPEGMTLLPVFNMLTRYNEYAVDGVHPGLVQNQRWVTQIYNLIYSDI